MDPKLKQLWIEDLRAGHPQTRKVLKNRHGHCCLGRLCEVIVANKLGSHDQIRIYDNYIAAIGPSEEFSYGFCKIAGMTREQEDKCINMNDGGKSFTKIADWIEANL